MTNRIDLSQLVVAKGERYIKQDSSSEISPKENKDSKLSETVLKHMEMMSGLSRVLVYIDHYVKECFNSRI